MKTRKTWILKDGDLVPGYFDEDRKLHEGEPPEPQNPPTLPDAEETAPAVSPDTVEGA